ncbi:hypothetical protein E0K89_004150 [Aquicoccus sp. SCR17]|nr:hypothetical protein [Carideicomes alvinocaridis]
MRKLRGHRVAVDQGEVHLFSDFATDGEMWTGEGTRERRQRVEFAEPFSAPPVVQVGLSLWDMDCERNIRADIAAEDVDAQGFVIVFRTWSDSRVARVRMTWLAIGETMGADDWEVD